jgi:hypothetical protein
MSRPHSFDKSRLRSVTRSNPCAVCGGDHKCSVGNDGLILCGRTSGDVPGFKFIGPARGDDQFSLYRRDGDPQLYDAGNRIFPNFPNGLGGTAKKAEAGDWRARFQRSLGNLTPALRRELAESLGVPEAATCAVAIGFDPVDRHGPCFTHAEVDGAGQTIGFSRRYRSGEKKAGDGCKRGLTDPGNIEGLDGPILCPEGLSDTLALAALCLATVGRPGNMAGVEHLAARLKDLPESRTIIIVGENDPRPDGKWPGRDGAAATREKLSAALGRPVFWSLPPAGHKDVRAWLIGQRLDPTDADAWGEAGQVLLAHFLANLQPRPSHEGAAGQAAGTDPELDRDTTAADLVRVNARIRWAWDLWLPVGVLTILAADPGVGKTRLCMDLARRVYLGLPWPDGSPATFPKGSTTLWVPADNNHCELGSLPTAFGFPLEAVYVNTTNRDPYAGTMLDTREEVADLEARIKRLRPAVVFIDTTLSATLRTSHKPEDAKAFYGPLQQIAARQSAALVCNTHLNADGKPLGRRIMGQGRVVMQLECPDEFGQPHRRKLWVTKSNALMPPALGVTMGDTGNEYDRSPPAAPDGDAAKMAQTSRKLDECGNWLTEQLESGPKRVSIMRTLAEGKGFSAKVLYAARAKLELEEFEAENRKWWKLTSK